MRHAVLIVALAACGRGAAPSSSSSGAEGAAAPAAAGRVVRASFRAEALGVDKPYLVYLPAGYDAATERRYPTIYMLHGLGGNQGNWIESGALDRAADGLGLQAIVVMPDGDASFYADWASGEDREACAIRGNPFNRGEQADAYCVATPAYETYVVRDLIAHVDATYRTAATRASRGIGGLSMGGFGALALAMRHRDTFAAAASHSGVDSLFYAGPFPYQRGQVVLLDDVKSWGRDMDPFGSHVRRIFGGDLARWRDHDPVTLAQGLAPGDLALYLDCGTDDGFQLHNHAQYLHDVLLDRGIAHDWYLGPGRHDFGFWKSRIDDSLGFFARSLTPASP